MNSSILKVSLPTTTVVTACVGPTGGLALGANPLPPSLSRSDSSFSFSTVMDAAMCHPESPLGLKVSVPQFLGDQFIPTTLWGQPFSGGALAAGAASVKTCAPLRAAHLQWQAYMQGPLTLSQYQSSSWIQLRPLTQRSAYCFSLSTPTPILSTPLPLCPLPPPFHSC